MASDKQRRKATKAAKNSSTPSTGPHRHPDGDRRRRDMGMMAREALKNKALLRQIGMADSSTDSEPDANLKA